MSTANCNIAVVNKLFFNVVLRYSRSCTQSLLSICAGDIESGVEHLSNAVAVCGQAQQLLQVLQQTLPPQVFQLLIQRLPMAGQVCTCIVVKSVYVRVSGLTLVALYVCPSVTGGRQRRQ